MIPLEIDPKHDISPLILFHIHVPIIFRHPELQIQRCEATVVCIVLENVTKTQRCLRGER